MTLSSSSAASPLSLLILLTSWRTALTFVIAPPWANEAVNPCSKQSWQLIFWPPDGRCYQIFEQGPCSRSQELSFNEANKRAECRCPKNLIYWPETDRCYGEFSRGPCDLNQYLERVEDQRLNQSKSSKDAISPKFRVGRSRKNRVQCAAVQRCENGWVFWPPKKTCHQLYTQGPCHKGDLLIVNPLTAEPYCGCDPVLLRQYYFAPLQLCYEHHTRGPCEAGLLFSYNHTTGTTSCDCGAKSPNYHPGTGHCYQFQTKGPCRKGQEFRKGSGGGECSCRPGYVHWSANGECYKAFTPGPCNNSEFIVPDKRRPIEENSGRCVENPCPRAHLYFPTSDGQSGQDSSVKCHKVGSRGPCPLGQLVVFEKYSGKSYRGECGCSPGYNQNYWPEDERCYEWYTRGPCKESFLFQYNRDSGKTECVCDEHEGFVFWNETGKCYRLYTQGPCPNYAWLIPGDAPGEVFCECRTGFHFDPDSYSCLPLFSSPPLAMPLTMSEPAGVDWARGIFVTPGAERRSDRGEPDYSWLTSSRWARGGRSRTFFQQRPFSRKSASFRHRQPYQQHRQY